MSCGRSEHVESRGIDEPDEDRVPASSHAVALLDAAILSSGIPRKVLADECVGVGEAQFSKLTHAAALDLLDRLPTDVVVDWLDRLGRMRGFVVRIVEPAEIDQALFEKAQELATLVRLRQVRVKVSMGSMVRRRMA